MKNVKTIYLIHHSHTDIGYTSDTPIVWDLHERFIDIALDLALRYAEVEGPEVFRWTVETTEVFAGWLKHASPERIQDFQRMEKAGRIEVTGMLANITPLFDTDQFVESLQLTQELRDMYGFTIRHAMNCDVNGQNWPVVDGLLDAGIRSFSMAINTHFGGIPFEKRPVPFYWVGPSGRKILAYSGFPYSKGWDLGIGRDKADFKENWWPRLKAHLEAVNYPLSSVLVQTYHPFGDNGSGYEGFCEFIKEWNESEAEPKIVFATPSMWVDAVAGELDQIETFAGDWTDYWNFGAGSSARETRINRASRERLRAADGLAAGVFALSKKANSLSRSMRLFRREAWTQVHFWDEHTWGADISVTAPGGDDTASQWNHKAQLAYKGRSLSLMLQRDGLAELARLAPAATEKDVLIYNPLPWARKISGLIPTHVLTPRGTADDATAGRHYQDREFKFDFLTANLPEKIEAADAKFLSPVEAPGYGFVVVNQNQLVDPVGAIAVSEESVVENEHFRLTFDTHRGGLRSIFDKRLNREWINPSDEGGANAYVHEELADKENPWPRHLLCRHDWSAPLVELPSGWKGKMNTNLHRPTRVALHRVFRSPLGVTVVQHLEAAGCDGLLRQSVFLPAEGESIECESAWNQTLTTHPEAMYLAFPLNLTKNTQARFDVGGVGIEAGKDQLPGVCRDYFTAQRWVDLNDGDYGMVIATPDVPMIQLGGLHFAEHQMEFKLDQPVLYGWVTNNYWETNFRAHQPGEVRARYRLLPYAGAYDETRCHRFGAESMEAGVLAQNMGEPSDTRPILAAGSLLGLPEANQPQTPVITLHVKPGEAAGGVVARFLNASDAKQEAVVSSGILKIESAAICDLFEKAQQPLSVSQGCVKFELGPREMKTVWLGVKSE